MSAVRSCGCDGIDDSDASKYDSNRHYFTCHLFTYNSSQDTTEPVKEEDQLNTKFDDLVTNIEVIDSSIDPWATV